MKLSLATKIFLGFTVLLGTFALLAFLSVREIRAVADDLRTIRDGHLALARHSAQLEAHQLTRFRDIKKALAETDPTNRDMILRLAIAYFPYGIPSTVEDARAVCQQQIAAVRTLSAEDADTRIAFYRGIITRIDRIAEQHEALEEVARTTLAKIRNRESVDGVKEKVEAAEQQLRGDAYQLNKYINDETDRAVRRAEQDERNAVWRVVVMTAIALIVGLLLTFLSARSLKPISRLVHYARAISRGDYEQEVDPRGDDELALLAEELKRMAKARKEREAELDRQTGELEAAYKRVAELKRYHESVVRSLHTAIVVTDRELVVTSVNRAAEAHWGLPPDVRGKKLDELELGAVLIAVVGPLSELVLRGKTVDANALSIGEHRADVTIAPFESQRGDVLGLVLAIEDVTEQMRTKEALIRSERLAAIGRMSAHVTHEIRNPLSSIGLNAEMLQDLVHDKDEAGTLCSAIVREVDRLSAITDEYLRFARLPRPELEEEEIGPLLTAIASFMKRDLEAAHVKLELDLDPDLPKVRLDADQMRQAILNLVRNAKESMPQGGRIVLSAKQEGASVVIGVRDSGGGIPRESLDRIFDPFFSTKLTGTGLGLALTQQIVTEHGGQLRVDSAVGVGSEFRIVMKAESGASTGMVFVAQERPEPTRLEEVETTGLKGRAAG
jgi:nitrogen fixation/metabolism regulation signal transduction histidine kinase